LTSADEAFVRRFRTGRNMFGAAVQLCTLPWSGSWRTMSRAWLESSRGNEHRPGYFG
jgi:hypothetical protein